MNILFIEDEKELTAIGIAQLELKGYQVFPAYNLAEARAVLDDSKCTVHFLIADHRLPDGWGIQFVIEMKESFPNCKCAVVSGCLTPRDEEVLKEHKIPYFRKPLLYANVIDQLRRLHAMKATEHAELDAAKAEESAEGAEESAEGADQEVKKSPDLSGSTKKRGVSMWPFKLK